MNLKCSSTSKLDQRCQLKDLTMTQIQYLKIIDTHDYITISDLAKEVNNSKPTVTEMIKKFTTAGCVYKEKCHHDGRKSYLILTDRGKQVARMEEYVMHDLIQAVVNKLNKDEIEVLVRLLEKTLE